MSATYGWVITHVNTKDLGDDMADEVGTIGPRDISDENLDMLKAGHGITFRMTDDDGIWYYRGRLIVDSDEYPALSDYSEPERDYYIASAPWDEEEAFGPLHDFGMPNAGAVNLFYRLKNAEGEAVWAVV